MSWKFRYVYGVSQGEIEAFAEDACVKAFLGRYKRDGKTWGIYGRCLCMFFKWVRVVKGLNIKPGEFLNLLLEKRGSSKVEDRVWARGSVNS